MAFGVDRWGFFSRFSSVEIVLSHCSKPSASIVCECAGAWVFIDAVEMVDDGCAGGGVDYRCDENVRPCQSNGATGLVVFYGSGGFNGSGNRGGATASRLDAFY